MMHRRSGPFWGGIEGRASMPPAAATLGLESIDVDAETGTIELAFAATEEFTIPTGRLTGKGRIVHRDGDLVFLEAALLDADGTSSPPRG
jgi:hypothetical protein